METLISGNHFIAGKNPSAAEESIFPEIRLLKRAIERKPELMRTLGFGDFAEFHPKLSAWRDRVEALPNMNKTLPYHWHV